jgi:hypothetical protein
LTLILIFVSSHRFLQSIRLCLFVPFPCTCSFQLCLDYSSTCDFIDCIAQK